MNEAGGHKNMQGGHQEILSELHSCFDAIFQCTGGLIKQHILCPFSSFIIIRLFYGCPDGIEVFKKNRIAMCAA